MTTPGRNALQDHLFQNHVNRPFGPDISLADAESAGMNHVGKELFWCASFIPMTGPVSDTQLSLFDAHISPLTNPQKHMVLVLLARIGHERLFCRVRDCLSSKSPFFDHVLLKALNTGLTQNRIPAALRAKLYDLLPDDNTLFALLQSADMMSVESHPLTLWSRLADMATRRPDLFESLCMETPFLRLCDLPSHRTHIQHQNLALPTDTPNPDLDTAGLGAAVRTLVQKTLIWHEAQHQGTRQTLKNPLHFPLLRNDPAAFFQDPLDLLIGLLSGMSHSLFSALLWHDNADRILFETLVSSHGFARFHQKRGQHTQTDLDHLIAFAFTHRPPGHNPNAQEHFVRSHPVLKDLLGV